MKKILVYYIPPNTMNRLPDDDPAIFTDWEFIEFADTPMSLEEFEEAFNKGAISDQGYIRFIKKGKS